MVRVKICGIANQADAFKAVSLGADALGFIFAESPRKISPEGALEIIRCIPPFVQIVGVFVDEDPKVINDIINFCGLDLVQLHGEESPGFCTKFMPRTIKAFRIKDEASLKRIRDYKGHVRALLFDTYSKNKMGGTGRTFDWDLALKGGEHGLPIVLSGGLSPSNIERAISSARPYAIDVNSGIEESPGVKDYMLMEKFMKIVRRIQI